MRSVRFGFACELEANDLQSLFADGTILQQLIDLDAGISLGLLDLSPERADIVRRLNAAGIPVVAWLLLPREQGYYFNLSNALQAAARYAEFRAWTAEHGLHWDGVGIDVEPDLREVEQLAGKKRWGLLPAILHRALDGEGARQAQAAYHDLVAQIIADGYPVDCYQFPWIVDERLARSTLLQRLFGIMQIPAAREVLMLYSSFPRAFGPGILWSYASRAQRVVIGSTGGGVVIGDGIEPLTWEEFERDLRIVRQWQQEVYIFSLEGCVQQNFLPRLQELEWEQQAIPRPRQALPVGLLRRLFQGALWAGEHPAFSLIGLAGLAGLARGLWPM